MKEMNLNNFGDAIKAMQFGQKVQRAGWNGKGMFLFHVSGNAWDFRADVNGVDGLETESFICMKTAAGTLIPWLASQADIQATDWQLVID